MNKLEIAEKIAEALRQEPYHLFRMTAMKEDGKMPEYGAVTEQAIKELTAIVGLHNISTSENESVKKGDRTKRPIDKSSHFCYSLC